MSDGKGSTANGVSERTITIETRRGISVGVVCREPANATASPIVFLHGAMGLLGHEPALDQLAGTRAVYAPLWPGYGEHPGETELEDMLDFALHGWDVVDALQRDGLVNSGPVNLIGHCMGAMIAAEMTALAPSLVARLALVAPLGVWLDAHPIPDLFATMPYEFPQLLFADPTAGTAALIGGTNWNDPKAVEAFLVSNARRLGTAGKILFPVPNRRLSKRLYRIVSPTLLLWGDADVLVPTAPYMQRWRELLPHASHATIAKAGHLVLVEQGEASAQALRTFFA